MIIKKNIQITLKINYDKLKLNVFKINKKLDPLK